MPSDGCTARDGKARIAFGVVRGALAGSGRYWDAAESARPGEAVAAVKTDSSGYTSTTCGDAAPNG